MLKHTKPKPQSEVLPPGRVEPDTPMEDFWPPLTFTDSVMYAYKRAELDHLITVERIIFHKSAATVTVRYLSAIPVQAWCLEALADYRKEFFK